MVRLITIIFSFALIKEDSSRCWPDDGVQYHLKSHHDVCQVHITYIICLLLSDVLFYFTAVPEELLVSLIPVGKDMRLHPFSELEVAKVLFLEGLVVTDPLAALFA